jgi:hypothetical protein
MGWRWKQKARKSILRIIVRLPLSFLIKTRFQLSTSTHHVKTKKFHNEEFSFDDDSLLYELKTGIRGEANSQVVNWHSESLQKEYKVFTKKLIDSGFFESTSDVHFEHYDLPRLTYTYTYQLNFIWTFNGKIFQTLRLIDTVDYGLEENVRERFQEFLDYLFLLAERKNPTYT